MARVPSDQVAVDVVIPTYARGEKINATLASIRASSHHNFTLWIMDQSEDDHTRRCIECHAAEDNRIRYIHSTLNGPGPKKMLLFL